MNETKDVVYAGVDNGVVLVVGVEDPVLPFHGGGGEVHQQLSGVLWVGHSGGSVDFIKGAVGIGGSVVDSHNSFIVYSILCPNTCGVHLEAGRDPLLFVP